MTDLREVFEMATKQMDPDQDSWQEQQRRQRRTLRNRRIGAFAAVAVILIAAAAFVLTQKKPGSGAATHGSPSVPVQTSSIWTPVVVGLDGRVHARVLGIPPNARSMSVSPDGRSVVFVTGDLAKSRIGTVGVDGTNLRIFPAPPATNGRGLIQSFPTAGALMPAWSPDGSKIAFSNGDIFVMNADGSGLKNLTAGDKGVDLWPSWSPDGRTIVYSNSGVVPINGSGFSATQEIWTVPATGGVPSRLTDNGGADDMPSFSPDGTTIAFAGLNGLTLMDASGGNVRVVKGDPVGFNPRWSPDGSRLSYTTFFPRYRASDGGPLLRVHLVNLRTGVGRVLAGFVDSDIDSPHWMPSGAAGQLIENRYVG